jgi:hypothetical protein
MARRRFVWSKEADALVEVSPDYEQPGRLNADGTLWNDRHYDGLKASDGTDISSRTKHREYMKANGLTTIDDFKGVWENAAKERADYYTGKKGTVNKTDIEFAIHQLNEQQRNRR